MVIKFLYESEIKMCKITPKREGFFRLGIGGSGEPKKEQYPDVTPSERQESKDFWKEIFNFCKEVVQESVREQGYEFVSTGKGRTRELRRIASD